MALVVTLAYYPFLFTWIGNTTSLPSIFIVKLLLYLKTVGYASCEMNGDSYFLHFFPSSSAL